MIATLDQWVAPSGYDRLRADCIYFRLRTDSVRGRIIFVAFDGNASSAHLVILRQDRFEAAIGKEVLPAPKPLTIPPWLESFGSLSKVSDLIVADEVAIEAERKRAADQAAEGELSRDHIPVQPPSEMSVSQVVASRVVHLHEAVEGIGALLAEDDPDRALNRYARSCTPKQNETRFRFWFYAYVCWGRNRAVLLPHYHLRGKYERQDAKYAESAFGRSSNDGTRCPTHPSKDLIELIVQSFVQRAKLGSTRDTVYADAMRKDFGCCTRQEQDQNVFFHPDGKPYPTSNQYWYRCEEALGREHIKKVLRGAETHRNKDATSQGSFSMSLTNVCERIHADACYSDEYARSYVDDEPLAKIAVAEFYDGVTGMGVGIGGSLEVESSWSYLEALFCMAVPKSFFGMLIGYPITDKEWPGYGIPPQLALDRGPGAHKRALDRMKSLFLWRSMSPSNAPQSNATAESRHDRSETIHGAPAYKVSKHTPIQMFWWYVERMLKRNRSSSALARVGVDQLIGGQVTPLDMYRDMLSRARTDAQPIPIDLAVSTLLPPLQFHVKEDALMLGPVRYSSSDFMSTDTGHRLRKLNGQALRGHSLSLTSKYAWVEADGMPVMVQALLPFRDGEEQLYLSPAELAQLAKSNAQAGTWLRNAQPAEIAASQERYEAKTGVPANVVTRKKGRKGPGSARAREETRMLKSQ